MWTCSAAFKCRGKKLCSKVGRAISNERGGQSFQRKLIVEDINPTHVYHTLREG